MSNKTQILCNKNNRGIFLLVEEIKKDIKTNSQEILRLKFEEKDILNDISRLKKGKETKYKLFNSKIS